MQRAIQFFPWRIALLMLLSTCIQQTASAAEDQASQPMPKISVGASVPIWYVQVPYLVAKTKGFFDEVGLTNVDYKVGGLDLQLVKGVASGSFDIGLNTGTVTVLKAIEQGGPLKMIAGSWHGATYVLYAKKGTTAGDMKGKTIAIGTRGDITTHMLRLGLRQLGLDPETDVTMVPAGGPGARIGALFAGQVAASINHYSLIPVHASKGFVPLVNLEESEALKPWSLITVAANTDFAKQHPRAVTAFLTAIYKARKWYQDPDNVAELKQIVTDADIKIRNDQWFAFEAETDRKTSPADWNLPREHIENVVKFSVQTGVLKRVITYEEAVDLSYLEAARR